MLRGPRDATDTHPRNSSALQWKRLAHRLWHGRPRPCRNFAGCVSVDPQAIGLGLKGVAVGNRVIRLGLGPKEPIGQGLELGAAMILDRVESG